MNKVALITGSARRIGAEIARILHENEINIIIHHLHSTQEAEVLCDELNVKRANSAHVFQADLNNLSQLAELVLFSYQAWGRLDILINNASRFYKTQLIPSSENEWEDLMHSNLRAPYFLSMHAVPHLKKTKGIIVNITDVHAEDPMRDYAIYCISKAGLSMMTKCLAKELAPDVRVNAVAPGVVSWPEGNNSLSEEMKNKIIQRNFLQRLGCPSDVANAVLFLVKKADYITGQTIQVAGH